TMLIQFTCSCGRMLNVPASHAGERARCPICSAIVMIPISDENNERMPRIHSDQDEETEQRGRKERGSATAGIVLIVALAAVLVLVTLSGAGFAAYWFLIRSTEPTAAEKTASDASKSSPVASSSAARASKSSPVASSSAARASKSSPVASSSSDRL